jgi:uncharacterized membrane protein YbhN (UPF0104 family)
MFRRIVNRRTLGRWLLGLLLLAGLVAWVQQAVGWRELLSPWVQFPPARLALLLLLTTLSYLFRAVRVYDYTAHIPRGAFPATLRLSLLHNTLNNFLPMRLGELAYPLLMKRYFGQGYLASGMSLVWIRLLDLHFLGLLGLAFLHQARPAPWWPPLMLVWLALMPGIWWGHGRLQRLMRGRSGGVARQLNRVLGHLPEDGWRLLRVWVWTLLSWALKFWSYTAVVLYFADMETWRAVFGTIGAELSSVLPLHGVAGSGSYELAMAAVLLPLGLDMETTLKAAVNLHLYLLGASLLLGLGALLLPRPVPPTAIGQGERSEGR